MSSIYVEDTQDGTVYHRACVDAKDLESMKDLALSEVSKDDVCGECGVSVGDTPYDPEDEDDDKEAPEVPQAP